MGFIVIFGSLEKVYITCFNNFLMSKISKKTYKKYARDYFENEEHEEDDAEKSHPEEEADWSSFDKLKPWQIDLLEAYSTPGSSSEDPMEEILSAKKLSRLKKRAKKRNLEEDKREKQVKMRNAFINLKLARTSLVPEITKKPKRMIHGLLSILKESSESESVPEEQSSESEDSTESIETPPLDEGSDSDDSAHRRTFVGEKEKKEIDELFSHNFFDLTSKSRRQRECRIPKMCYIEDDKPPINVSPSYKTLTEENLREKGRDYFLHRITYVFTFDEPDAKDQQEFETMFNSYINDQNDYYDDKYKLTGLALFYKEGYGLVMVEGSELEVMVHFHGFKGSDVFKLMDNSKILYIHGHAIRRYIDNFVFCTVNSSPISDEDDKSSSEIIQSIHLKIKKCCQALSRKSTSSEDFYELPKSYEKFVPPVSEVAFCTDYEPLRDLKEYVDETEKIPDVSDSSDEGWPPTDESIPFNVFNEARGKRFEKAIVPSKGATSQWTYSKKFFKSKKKDKKEKPVGSLKKRIIKSLMKNVKIKEEGKILV